MNGDAQSASALTRRIGEPVSPVWSARARAVTVALAGAFIIALLWQVSTYRLWYDEIFSVQVVQHGWIDMVRFIRDYDPHPPLWYLLLKAWTVAGGQSYGWLGLFPAMWAVLTVAPFLLAARELGLRPFAVNLAFAMMALNGYLLGSAQELRMYTFLWFLTTCSLWLFVRYCNADRRAWRPLVLLTIVNLCIVSTHYYGWLAVATEGVFLLAWDWRKGVRFAGTMTLVVMASLPWVFMVVHAAGTRVSLGQEAIAFSARPTAFSILLFYSVLDGVIALPRGTVVGCALFMAPVMLWIARAWYRRQADGAPRIHAAWLLGTFAFVPVAVAGSASRLLPFSVWGQRHLILVAVPYALLVGLALDQVRPRWLRSAWTGLLAIWIVGASVEAGMTAYKVPGWDRLVAQMISEAPPSGTASIPVYALNPAAAYDVQFYLDRAGERRFHTIVVKKDTARNRQLYGPASLALKPYWAMASPVLLVDALNDLPPGLSWFLDDGGDDGDAWSAWGSDPSIRTLLTRRGVHVGAPLSAAVVIRRWNARSVEMFTASRPL